MQATTTQRPHQAWAAVSAPAILKSAFQGTSQDLVFPVAVALVFMAVRIKAAG